MIPNNIQQKITDINEAITSKIINTEKEVLAEIRDAFGINKITLKIEWNDEEDIVNRRPSEIKVRVKDSNGNLQRMEENSQDFNSSSSQGINYISLNENNHWENSCYIESNDYTWDIATIVSNNFYIKYQFNENYEKEISTNKFNTVITYSIKDSLNVSDTEFYFDNQYVSSIILLNNEQEETIQGVCKINGYPVKGDITIIGKNEQEPLYNYGYPEIVFEEIVPLDSNGRFSFTIDKQCYLYGLVDTGTNESQCISTQNVVIVQEDTETMVPRGYFVFPKGSIDEEISYNYGMSEYYNHPRNFLSSIYWDVYVSGSFSHIFPDPYYSTSLSWDYTDYSPDYEEYIWSIPLVSNEVNRYDNFDDLEEYDIEINEEKSYQGSSAYQAQYFDINKEGPLCYSFDFIGKNNDEEEYDDFE